METEVSKLEFEKYLNDNPDMTVMSIPVGNGDAQLRVYSKPNQARSDQNSAKHYERNGQSLYWIKSQ